MALAYSCMIHGHGYLANRQARIGMQVDNPGSHHSDSFYFSGNTLILHNKATYTYTDKS
jgi:hypothetical protein